MIMLVIVSSAFRQVQKLKHFKIIQPTPNPPSTYPFNIEALFFSSLSVIKFLNCLSQWPQNLFIEKSGPLVFQINLCYWRLKCSLVPELLSLFIRRNLLHYVQENILQQYTQTQKWKLRGLHKYHSRYLVWDCRYNVMGLDTHLVFGSGDTW